MDGENRSNLAVGVAIGLSVAVALGLAGVFIWLLTRRDSQQLSAPAVNVPVYLPPWPTAALPAAQTYLSGPSVVQQPISSVPAATIQPRMPRPTSIRNVRLPTYGADRDAVRVATATDVPCRITVRVVTPPGTQAALAFDFNDLAGNVPSGDVLVLGAGDSRDLHLAPNQSLYAKATLPGTMVSVVMAEAGMNY